MPESIGPIASAVILPDPEPEAPKSPRLKRRRSSEPELSDKRPKVSGEPNESENEISRTTLEESPQILDAHKDVLEEKPKVSARNRPKSSVQEEKKRGQRLFGGLLSTLSQTTPNGQQRRRQEIEKRQQEKAQQQKAEDEGRRAQKLASLKAVRKAEGIKFSEESMRTRHTNMLALAHFLCTKTEPKLYYKPWELLPEEENRIKTQIAEAEALINREVQEFNQSHFQDSKQESPANGETNMASKETVGEPGNESPFASKLVDTTNDTPTQVVESDQVTSEKHSLEEHNGEVVVENEEDTVIY